ncbi:MAG: HAD family hydrolase [Myxococcota bacterium]
MTAVLWDLDGTLVDSAGDIARAVDVMLARHGLRPLGEATVRRFIGEGARRLVDRCVAEAGGVPGEAHLGDFLAAYAAAPVVTTTVFDGLRAIVEDIRSPQAIVTNKPEALTRAVLAGLDLARHFPVVIGGDTLPVRKPDPAPIHEALRRLGATTAVFVGDGPPDVAAARAAGLACVGVEWGIHEPAGADVRVPDARTLRDALRRLGVHCG